MNKFVAIACVISWSGFWAFGFLALSSDNYETSQVIISALLAFAGLLSGVFAYMHLARERPVNYRRVAQG